MKPFLKMTLIAAFAAAAPVTALAEGFDQNAFDRFVDGRVGTGEPVYWYSIGTIRSYPDGELLFGMEGFDAARRFSPDAEKAYAEQYNRKIYFYTDAETGDVLEEHDGETVSPIAYPYQFITYELKGDAVETFVEQGKAPNIRRLGPSQNMSARSVADTLVVTAPVYLDFPIPNTDRRIDAFENYDFFFHPEGSVREPHQLAWVRYGDLPAWAGGGKGIYHLVTWRADSWEEIPERLRVYIEKKYPLWTEPPASLEEVRALQESEDDDTKGF